MSAKMHHLNGSLDDVLLENPDLVISVLNCLFSKEHLLIEDVPGLGKTTLAKSLANFLDGTWLP